MKIANTEDRLLLRVEEAALRLGVGRSKCYDLINAHVIPSVRIGRSVRVPVEGLKAWVAEREQPAVKGRS